MTSLRDIQTACYRAFTNGDANPLLPMVRGNAIAPEFRVDVYRNNSREINRKALAASYPVIERLVGDACLAGLARQYSRLNPSRCGDLQRYGAKFPGFLDRTYGDSQFRYLADVARLEWALEEIHLEPDEEPLDINELARFDPGDFGNLVFSVRRALRLVSSRFPVLSIWRANQPGNDSAINLDQGGENIAVLRRGSDLEMHRVDTATFRLASNLRRGATLVDAWDPQGDEAEDNTTDDAGAASNLTASLQSILNLGLLAEVSVAVPPPATP